jgi:hypothetical protein
LVETTIQTLKGEKNMDAITNLVATVALLLALAAGVETTKGRVEVSSPTSTHSPSSRPMSGGCEEWGCGMNHNETLVLDAEPMK